MIVLERLPRNTIQRLQLHDVTHDVASFHSALHHLPHSLLQCTCSIKADSFQMGRGSVLGFSGDPEQTGIVWSFIIRNRLTQL